MTFEWLVALRYLRSPHKPLVLRLVTWLAVLGIAAGVATLVVALAMNAGFRRTLQDRLLGVTAHVNLTSEHGGIRNYPAIIDRLRGVPGVRAVTPAIYQTVLLSAGGNARGIVVKGVDPRLEAQSNEILGRGQKSLDSRFALDADGIEAIFLGKTLAQELKLQAGDYVTLTSPQGRLTPFGMVPRTRRFRIAEIFDSNFHDYDANWGFVTLASAQVLAGTSDLVGVIEVRLANPDDAANLAPQLARAAGAGFEAGTWMEQNRALFRALRLEKLVTAIFVGLITFVAGLNILVVLALTVSDRAKDIAVLTSLGAIEAQVRRIFLWQGFLVGVLGTVSGLALGYGVAWAADRGRWVRLDPEIYAVPFVPFHVSLADAGWIIAATLAISLLATLLPARAAGRLRPVEILRFE